MPDRSTEPPAVDEAALLRGDRQAFEAFVRRETPRLYRFLLRYLHDEDEARSVMQETFLQAWQQRTGFEGRSKFSTWVFGIGVNLARTALRKRRRTEPMEEADLDRLQPHFRQGLHVGRFERVSPLDLAERADVQQRVRAAVDELPESYREVVVLRDLQGLSTEEAAEVLGLSRGNVRVRLHRARQALRALLVPYFAATPEDA